MARPSKLSDAQWDEIKRRALAGEKAADLAREFKVSKTAISVRVSKRIETMKVVANQIVDAEQALRTLPVSEQISVLSLADELRSISKHLAGAARYGAATAHRLAGIANAQVDQIDDAEPEASVVVLKRIGALTKLANDASTIGLNLLAANKEQAKKLNEIAELPAQELTDDELLSDIERLQAEIAGEEARAARQTTGAN